METPDKSISKRQQDIWFSCGAVKTMPDGVCRHAGVDSCGNVRADTSAYTMPGGRDRNTRNTPVLPKPQMPDRDFAE